MNTLQDMPLTGGRKLPEFTLRAIDFADIIGWEVKDTKYLIMKVEMIGKRTRKDIEESEGRERIEGDFQMLSIKVLGKEPVDAKSMEIKDWQDTVAKVKSGKI